MTSSTRGALVLLSLGLVGGPAVAMQATPPDRPTLCAGADLVLLGEPTSVDTAFSGDELRPVETTWDLWVDRVVVGELPPGPVQIVTAGGTIGDLTMTVSEQPEPRLDHRYLLLLTRRDDGRYVVRGGPAGLIAVARSADGLGESEQAALESLGACRVP